MNIAELSIRYRTITLVLTTCIVFGGYSAYMKLGRLEDPEFTIKSAQVITRYPGATAQEVAEEVTDKIEIAIQKLGQVDYITSVSQPGLSIITVEIEKKYMKETLPQIWDELRRKVGDAQGELPPGAEPSIVYDDFGDVYGVYYAVYGDDYSWTELYEYAKMLRRELLLVQDVADITISGDQQEAIYVEISRARLSQLGLSPELIYATLSGQNLISPSGRVQIGDLHLRIQPTGQLKSVEDIGELLILQNDGTSSKLRIKDIARIRTGHIDPPTFITRFNGRPAVGLGISTVEGGNVLVMGEAVSKRLRELQSETPIGMELGVISHQADSVNVAIDGFVVSLIEALVIVVGVLIFTMGMRSGLLIGLILLLTIAATFIVMQMKGVMLERISLGALIIALGMLVDNAIVIVEGMLVDIQRGEDRTKAASKIVSQTQWPLFGATVVAVLSFAAIGASQDSTGEYCRSLYLVILYSLMASWVLAITVTPLFGVMFLAAGKAEDASKDPYGSVFFRGYRAFLVFCMRFRWLTLVVMGGMLLVSIYGFGFVRKSFFPPSTRPQFMIHYWLPQGTHINKTDADLKQIADYLKTLPDITDTSSFAGKGALRFLLTYTPENSNPSYGMLLVGVKEYPQVEPVMAQVQDYLQKTYPDAQAFCRKFLLGPGEAQKIQIRLRGKDADVLRTLANQTTAILRQNPQIMDIQDDWRERVPLIKPVVAETQARNAGITRQNIAVTLQSAFEGVNTGVFRRADEIIPIIARSPDIERQDVSVLNDVQIWSPAAQRHISMSQVVSRLETTSENVLVQRRNRLPTITVKCDPCGAEASEVLTKLMPVLESSIILPPGYTLEYGGEYEDSGEAQKGLAGSIPIVVLLMALIIIILFNSLRKPLIIFLIIPLSLIGVTAGLLMANQPFGFMALLGFLSLAGMLIKNAIVLIDEINAQLASGKDPFLAIVDSGVSRVRPVSMAALTTVLGMVPLIVDAFFSAMAVTIMVGLTFATILTLIVVPVLFAIFFKIKPAD